MSKSTEVLLMPFRVGLAPVRRLGASAMELASSQHIAEVRLEEQAKDGLSREISTATTLAHELAGRLASGSITDPEIEQRTRDQLDMAANRIGYAVIEANGSLKMDELLANHDQLLLEE